MSDDYRPVAGTPLNPAHMVEIDGRDLHSIRARLWKLEDAMRVADQADLDVRREIRDLTGMLESLANRVLVLEAQCEQCLLLCRTDSALERKDVE